MACIIRRSNGIYYGVFSHKGKRVWRSTGVSSQEEASKQIQKMSSLYTNWDSLRLEDLRDNIVSILSNNLSPSTIALYKAAMTKFIQVVGNILVRQVQPYHVELFKSSRLNEVSPVKVSIDYRTLRSVFNRAVAFDMIHSSPFSRCKDVRVPRREPAYLSVEDLLKLTESISDTRLRSVVMLAVSTGMRLGEIVNLRWNDVDLSARVLHVRHSHDFTVKGGIERNVPVNQTALETLVNIQRISEYVFARERALKNPVASISRRFKRAVRIVGLPNSIHFHSLRHTTASWLLHQGVSLPHVQKILGHSKITTTMIYAHFPGEQLRESLNEIDDLLRERIPQAMEIGRDPSEKKTG